MMERCLVPAMMDLSSPIVGFGRSASCGSPNYGLYQELKPDEIRKDPKAILLKEKEACVYKSDLDPIFTALQRSLREVRIICEGKGVGTEGQQREAEARDRQRFAEEERLRLAVEGRLAQLHREASDLSQGKHTAEVTKFCRECGISPERAEVIRQEVGRQWLTDAFLSVFRKNFTAMRNLYLHPNIPLRKANNVRLKYSAFLQGWEELLAVYDGTMFGAGDDGFVLTNRGIGRSADMWFTKLWSLPRTKS